MYQLKPAHDKHSRMKLDSKNIHRLQGDHNNNKMELFNSEVRDGEKVMRGLKKVNTPILAGYQIYHNYIQLIDVII